MANMFRCTLASGGGALVLTVTCDADFAGYSVTVTDGTSTLTQTCPSSSPYEIEFNLPNVGQWTISSVISGETYSTQIIVSDYTAELEYGFNWKKWVTFGGLDPTDYTDLADVFSDEAAVRRLMTVHASADYLIDCVTDKLNDIDAFCANDTAMKWIGLRDYVCDGLTAITGVEAKFLESEYWERYLKDHVPTMTGNSAPYGTAFASTEYGNGYHAYKAFCDDSYWCSTQNSIANQYLGYKFTNPIKVEKLALTNANDCYPYHCKLQYSNDNSTWTDVVNGSFENPNITNETTVVSFDDTPYALYWRVFISDRRGGDNYVYVKRLQFYGRSLNVSVPVMTSNTAPYGEASSSSDFNTTMVAWKAFDGANSDSNDSWRSALNQAENSCLMYKSSTPFVVKAVAIRNRNDSANVFAFNTCKIQGSNDGFVNDNHDVTDVLTTQNKNYNQWSHYAINNSTAYKDYRILVLTSWNYNGSSIDSANVAIGQLQFYGVDYTEKEFETGSTKKWLYDHGVELEPITVNATGGASAVKNDSDIMLTLNAVTNSITQMYTTNKLDVTNYDLLRAAISSHFIIATSKPSFAVNESHNTASSVSTLAYVQPTTDDLPNKICCNISSIIQQVYIEIFQRNTGAANTQKMDITELWLE